MFFTYNQNNSGGSFSFEDWKVTQYVIIEADNYQEANSLAEEIGLYFDGSGDCPCCGNRWHELYSDDFGDEEPMIYGKPVDLRQPLVDWMNGKPFVFVHYKDGRVTSRTSGGSVRELGK